MAEIDPDWHFPYFDENMGRAVGEDYDTCDVLLIGRDLVEAVAALKADASIRGILIPGSISVVQQLLAAGLVDELRLLVHPVAARTGRRLFDDGNAPYHLKVTATEAIPTGVTRVIYSPTEAPPRSATTRSKTRSPRGSDH